MRSSTGAGKERRETGKCGGKTRGQGAQLGGATSLAHSRPHAGEAGHLQGLHGPLSKVRRVAGPGPRPRFHTAQARRLGASSPAGTSARGATLRLQHAAPCLQWALCPPVAPCGRFPSGQRPSVISGGAVPRPGLGLQLTPRQQGMRPALSGAPHLEEEGGTGAARPGEGKPVQRASLPPACPVASSSSAACHLGPGTSHAHPTPASCTRMTGLPPGAAPRHRPGPERALPACLRAPATGAGGWGQRRGSRVLQAPGS